MTYVPYEVFTECVRVGGIENQYEYQELHRRKILPTKLVPKNPSRCYKKHSKYAGQIKQIMAKKYGRKYNPKNKQARRLYQKITRQLPEVKALTKAHNSIPEVKARHLANARISHKKRRQVPEVKARNKIRRKIYRQLKHQQVSQKAYNQRPEVRERKRMWMVEKRMRLKQ